MVHRADLAAAEAAIGREVTFQRILHCIGIELFAVLELHVRAQPDQQRLAVGPRVAARQHRDDIELSIVITQRVAQGGHHHGLGVDYNEALFS
jgi:hypothetical protein